jgi:hypothetical protein
MITTKVACVAVCVIGFSLTLGAFSSGPPPNRNGVSGVYCTACHITNPLNSGEGSVRIVGLPSAWLPGETYNLQVIVSHPTQIRWGFEMSATGPNGDQAGDLIPDPDGRTRVQIGAVNGKQVQFIEHSSLGSAIGSSNIFRFTYQTPPDPNFGNIRFNVAGNAANGNGAPTGDFIYATEVIVPPLVAGPERQFVMATRGGLSVRTAAPSGTPLTDGFARLQTTTGTAPSGIAFVGYRPGNVLVTETGFPAMAPIRSGRIYAESGGGLNTGLAMANPNNLTAAVSLFFTDASGTDFGQSSLTIPANSQVAAFVSQLPLFDTRSGTRPITDARSFTFMSNVPLATAALRVRTNERGDMLMTGLPVADLAGSSSIAVTVPHIADGGGWGTEIVLVNNSDVTETGSFRFSSPSGQGMPINLDGQTGSQFTYSIPARSSRRMRTAGSAATTATGWLEIVPSGNTPTPSAAGVLSERASNATISETTIAAVPATNAFRLFAELSGNFAAREGGSVQTFFSISNSANSAVNVNIELTNVDGTVVVPSTPVSVPARGQFATFIGNLPGVNLPTPFNGIAWISAPAGSSISVAGLRVRYNERQTPDLLITGIPVFDEATTMPSETFFPQIVDSGGFSTQFVLIGVRGGASAGSLRFVSQSGQSLSLGVR